VDAGKPAVHAREHETDRWKKLLDFWLSSMSLTAWSRDFFGSAPLRMSWAVLVNSVAING